MAGIFIRNEWILNPVAEPITYNEKVFDLPQINREYRYVSIDNFFYERFYINISEEEKSRIKEYEKNGITELFKTSTNGDEMNIKALGFSGLAIDYIISKALIDQNYNLSEQEEALICGALFGIEENNNELYMEINKLGISIDALEDILLNLPQVIQIAAEEYDDKIPLNIMVQDENSRYNLLMKVKPNDEVVKLFLEGKYR